MIVYNITFHIDKTVLEEALTYLKSSYIPRAAASGFLLRPCLRRVMHTPDEEGPVMLFSFIRKTWIHWNIG